MAIYIILYYLKVTSSKEILLKLRENLTLEEHTNADYVGYMVDISSTSKYDNKDHMKTKF